jgi:predicted enzyme related to lactoylglutathione lyase
MQHLFNWVEIPVKRMQRAVKFYSAILGGATFNEMELGPIKYALFPSDDKFNCGALAQGESYTPSAEGIVIYLDGGTDLNQILSRVASAGGTVVMEKTFLADEAGYIAMFLDTEGNRIGLQNPK